MSVYPEFHSGNIVKKYFQKSGESGRKINRKNKKISKNDWAYKWLFIEGGYKLCTNYTIMKFSQNKDLWWSFSFENCKDEVFYRCIKNS